MYILVTYDVDTTSKEGARRLRCVAKACLDYGQRVQNSVFECVVTEAQYSLLKGRVRDIIDMSLDSVRFYILSKNENKRVEVIGVGHGKANPPFFSTSEQASSACSAFLPGAFHLPPFSVPPLVIELVF